MNCADFEVLFADYLDGNLDTQARTSVEEHIATCATCAAFAQDVRSAVEFIGHAETVEPPPELLTRIAFEIPRGREVKGWRAMLTPWAASDTPTPVRHGNGHDDSVVFHAGTIRGD